jgi:hypothetical protein
MPQKVLVKYIGIYQLDVINLPAAITHLRNALWGEP